MNVESVLHVFDFDLGSTHTCVYGSILQGMAIFLAARQTVQTVASHTIR